MKFQLPQFYFYLVQKNPEISFWVHILLNKPHFNFDKLFVIYMKYLIIITRRIQTFLIPSLIGLLLIPISRDETF